MDAPALRWGFDQLQRLREGKEVDAAVSQAVLDNVVDLAQYRDGKFPALGLMRASYGSTTVEIDETLAARAMIARKKRAADTQPQWRAGVSKGNVFGQLRGVMDIEGEHHFYISPPTGPKQVECVFPETLRAKMADSLFKTVRARGYLHYSGSSPFPFLLEA